MEKLIHYEKAYDLIHGICFSRYKVIETRDVSWELNFLFSKHRSKQTAEIYNGHGIDNLIVFRDYTDVVAVSSRKPKQGEHITALQIPAGWVHDLFVFPVQMPMWAQVGKIIWAIIPDRFVGFDKDGEPVFDEKVNCWFGWGSEKYMLDVGDLPPAEKMREELFSNWIALAEDEQVQHAKEIAQWLGFDWSDVLNAARKAWVDVDDVTLKMIYKKYIIRRQKG